MAHPFPKKRFSTFQGHAAWTLAQRRRTSNAMRALAACTLILPAVFFGDYVARKTAATLEMAPHCMAIGPCDWKPASLAQNTSN